jgi:FkbH-like protein
MSEPHIKCVIWDLDNTIWDGVLLEDAAVTLKPRIDEVIRGLDGRGILHSIASRNDRNDAVKQLQAFGLHEYFLYPEIGWDAKSVAIQRIVEKLNIGYDTILFVDDQAFERDEVASVHGEVWCLDSARYLELLDHPRLRPKYLTRDARLRRTMYQDDIRRQTEEASFVGPQESFLRQLGMVFEIAEAQAEDLLRAEELTYRTNQLNATGITYTVESLNALRQSGTHKILVCELTDTYGTYGKIGLALLERMPGAWRLKLLLFSCRVMSKGVGTVLLSYLRHAAKARGVRLLADFRETSRNRMMYITYAFAGFAEQSKPADGMALLENDLTDIPPSPDYLKTVVKVDWSGW